MNYSRLLLPAALMILGCNQENNNKNNGALPAEDPVTAHIDSSYKPGDNFFMFANNGWFKQHPIPASEKSNGIFRTIQDTINAAVKNICERSAANTNAKKGSNEQKIGDYYFSGMDTVTINKLGITPLNGLLDMVSKVKNTNELVNCIAVLNTKGVAGPYSFQVVKDEKNSSRYAIYLSQPRLGLPERDYYFNTDSRTAEIRKEYGNHLQNMFEQTGHSKEEASAAAKKIMQLETSLAKASRKMEDLRDPYLNYNKMSVAAAKKLTPAIDWDKVFTVYGLPKVDSVVVAQPEYFKALQEQMTKTSVDDWKLHLKWMVIHEFAEALNSGIEDENFRFYSGVLDGVKEKKPRWKTIVENTDASLGELIGQVYIKEYLPPGTKEKLLEIGNNIRSVYADHIKALDWMSDATKEKALSKLNKITMKVGYPDKWKDMSDLEITRNSYAENAIRVNEWYFRHMAKRYGQPVDRSEWEMYPQTYNAYYDPTSNEIVVPACNIIVPGFEGRMPDDAVLYGIIGGSTFGHEITHGFDDQGSQYDENGNLSDWWTKEDREKFNAKTKLIVEQFNEYVVLDSVHVRGENTQGENIADLGGVIMGYEAFKKTKQGQSKELINAYTPEQRYFLAYAYAWMVNRTDASLAKQIMSDVHSPAEFRINGPLADVDEFYRAFNIQPGDKMYRPEEKRVKIW